MRSYKNKLGIYITDEQITIYDSHDRILTGLFCTTKNDKTSTNNGNSTQYYPFRGSVVADFYACESILKSYVHKMLPTFHFGTEAYFSVSPVSGISELRAISDLYKFRKTYFSLEPITFLYGINKESGIVVALHKTMVEISLVKNLQILHYKWNYISDLIQECKEVELYRTTINLLSPILNSVNISEFSDIYLIADKTIAENNLLISFIQDGRFKYYSDSNIIIAKSVINAPKLENKT